MTGFICLICSNAKAQQNVGIGTNSPDNSAMLEVYATNKGLLIPRLTTIQRIAILSPAAGLLVYDTDFKQFWYFDGILWVQAIGPQGPAGPQGTTGAQGAIGPQGPTGTAGIAGITGPSGADGMDGVTGPTGPAGAIGLQGPSGPAGNAGPTGANGVNGITGPTGPAGPTGPSGAANAWLLTGNATTTPGTNFLGTTDVKDMYITTVGLTSPPAFYIQGNTWPKNFGLNTTTQWSGAGGGSTLLNIQARSLPGMAVISLVGQNPHTDGTPNTSLDFMETANGPGAGSNNPIAQILNNIEGTNAGSVGGNLTFKTKPDALAIAERMRITGAGNVGINTSTPVQRLDVNGNINMASTMNLRVNDVRVFSNQGTSNLFAGDDAGIANLPAGQYNSFFGWESGKQNTTGMYNTFLGFRAGNANIGGHSNVCIGDRAGAWGTATLGDGNTMIGTQAGLVSRATANTFLGMQAGYSTTTGTNNVFIGWIAGDMNTTGSNNTVVGNNADVGSIGLTNATALGANASVNASNALVLGGTGANAVNVGIGITTPNATSGLHIYKTGALGELLIQSNGHDGPTAGGRILFNNDVLANAQGNITFVNDGFGSSYMSMGMNYFANAILINGDGPFVSRYSNLSVGTTLYVSDVDNGIVWNRVGIATTAPTANLSVNGTADKVGGGAWAVFSDSRLKKDIAPFKDGLSVIEKINPVWFNYNGNGGISSQERYVGVIAQDMQQIAPYTVRTVKMKLNETDDATTDILSFDASAMFFILVNAIQEQQQIIDKMNAENTALRTNASDFESRLKSAETGLAKLNILLQKNTTNQGADAGQTSTVRTE
jgi:hypothetical protein